MEGQLKRGRGQPRVSPGEDSTDIKIVVPVSLKARLPNSRRGDMSRFVRAAIVEKCEREGL